ncbi:ras GTPase-activating protein nGAP isoform X5 [Octopus sinensis]|uniref:Ras GTPase-activating protein nGAP isoform X5 n=1 Tax=Octopus sinensis TaxID=2607531 RepID=A0A6P7TDQ2_9MOLL|nr:ras GTPase-activating protein nGAP isoform X5 [Octopus sinensis]
MGNNKPLLDISVANCFLCCGARSGNLSPHKHKLNTLPFGIKKLIKSRQPDSSNEKFSNDRRGSMPLVPSVDGGNMEMGTTSKLAHFFTKKGLRTNLKRTKSVTKLDRKRSASNVCERETSIISSRIRTSRSHESLLTNQSNMHNIELNNTGRLDIRPVHNSLLGQNECFSIPTQTGNMYYSCKNKEEQRSWVDSLRKGIQPNINKERRVDNSLKLWIWEAKNIPPKKRYFCEIFLDSSMHAKTSCKAQSEMLFWGEFFEFSNLLNIKQIILYLYREADKKKKKDKNTKIGVVTIPVCELGNKQLVEKWFTVNSVTVGKQLKENRAELPMIRVRIKYQSVQILPQELYKDFTEYLTSNYVSLCEHLEPLVSVRDKEDIATCLVHAMQHLNKAKNFLCDVVMAEISRLDNEHLTFRGNSIATKAMEAYMKLVGENYLQVTLREFVMEIIELSEDYEVDPTKLSNNAALQRNQANLKKLCEQAWNKISNSRRYFPGELREVFAGFRENCRVNEKEDLSDNLISASIFLRFLCPAILSPSLFKLIQEYPSDKAVRTLTLIAKAIQKLANFTQFGGKEEFMIFMNDFVEEEFENMKQFLKDISSEDVGNEFLKNQHAVIDFGKELSVLHSLLVETLGKANEATITKLHPLPDILNGLTQALNDPKIGKKQPNRKSQIYDNLATTPNSNPSVSSLVQLSKSTLHMDNNHTINMDDSMNSDNGGITQQTSGTWKRTNEANMCSAFNDISVTRDISDVSVSKHTNNNKDSLKQWWNDILTTAEAVNGYDNRISFIDDPSDAPYETALADKTNSDLQHRSHTSNSLAASSQRSTSQNSFMSSSGYQPTVYSPSTLSMELPLASQEQFSGSTLPAQFSSLGSTSFAAQHSSIQQPLSFSNPLYKHQRNSQSVMPSSSISVSGNALSTMEGAGAVSGTSSPMVHSSLKIPQTSSSSSLSSTDDSGTLPFVSVNTQVHQTRSPMRNLPITAITTLDSARKITDPIQKFSQLSSSSSSSESLCDRRSLVHSTPMQTDIDNLQHGPALQRINPLYGHCSPKPSLKSVTLRSHNQPGNSPLNTSCELPQGIEMKFSGARYEDPSRSLNDRDTSVIQCNTLPKRAEKDRHLATSSVSDEFSVYKPGARLSLAQQHSLHSGTQTVQHRKSEPVKTREETDIDGSESDPEYEKEVSTLKKQLLEAQSRLHEAERMLFTQESGTQQMMQDWQQRLEESEERMRKQQAEKDDQIKTVIERSDTCETLVSNVAVVSEWKTK